MHSEKHSYMMAYYIPCVGAGGLESYKQYIFKQKGKEILDVNKWCEEDEMNCWPLVVEVRGRVLPSGVGSGNTHTIANENEVC